MSAADGRGTQVSERAAASEPGLTSDPEVTTDPDVTTETDAAARAAAATAEWGLGDARLAGPLLSRPPVEAPSEVRPGQRVPLIVGLGGTMRPDSSSAQALTQALRVARGMGARTQLFAGPDLPRRMYDAEAQDLTMRADALITSLRAADGIVLSSPCYHGGVSGVVKNAIDYVEAMRDDERPYFHGRAVGVIGCGYGNQGPVSVLNQLRLITHSLRGWPTPMGVAINSAVVRFEAGECLDAGTSRQIEVMMEQVVTFAMGGLGS